MQLAAMKKQVESTPVSSATRDRILDAAEVVFAEHGFAGAAMRDIAALVDLNAASLYNHFSGKQELYAAVLERGLLPMFEILEELALTDWTIERIDAIADTLVAHLAQRPQVPRLMLHESLAGGEHIQRLARDWLRPLYAQALKTVQKSRTMRGWDEAELPLLLMTFHHLLVGHFAVAPMLQEVLDMDPLSPEAVERQRQFVRKVAQLLLLDDTASWSKRPRRTKRQPRKTGRK